MSLNEVCRACLRTGRPMHSVLEAIVPPSFDTPPSAVVDIWKIFNKILIAYEDKYPDKICIKCLDEIQRTYTFVLKCERSEQILRKMKNVKICLKKLKTVAVLREYTGLKNIRSQNVMYPNSSEIKTENVESNHGYDREDTDKRQFKASIHANYCSQSIVVKVNSRSQNILKIRQQDDNSGIKLSDDLNREDDGREEEASTAQNIKQEPEPQICVEDNGIDTQDKSSIESLECPTSRYECRIPESLEKHFIENHLDESMCKLYNNGFECKAIEHRFTHLHVNNLEEVLSKSPNIKNHKCKVESSKMFEYKFALSSHLKIHTGEKPFKCEICAKSFRHNHDLKKHSRCHTGDRPFKCDICPKTYRHKTNLTDHSKRHTTEAPFKCEICTKSFHHKQDLTKHLRCHTGERPYKCEICMKDFRQKIHLTGHLRCHTGERPFKCAICPKTFQHKHDLTDHLRCHTGEQPFKCEICTKAFNRKNLLTEHLRKHTGERPFKCEICPKTFQRKTDLTRHSRQHAEKKVRNREKQSVSEVSYAETDSQIFKNTPIVQNNFGIEQFDHMCYGNDILNDVLAARDIKNEPELDICVEENVFDEIKPEYKSSTEILKCLPWRYDVVRTE